VVSTHSHHRHHDDDPTNLLMLHRCRQAVVFLPHGNYFRPSRRSHPSALNPPLTMGDAEKLNLKTQKLQK